MGRSTIRLVTFINEMPDEKLLDVVSGIGQYKTDDYYTVVTPLSGAESNMQTISIFGSKFSKVSTARTLAGKAVTEAKVPTDNSWTADMIRNKLLANRKI